MFDCQLAISRIDPNPPAPLPSHSKICVQSQSVVDESDAGFDVANDEGERVRAPGQCYRIGLAFDPMLSSIEHIRAGKLRALAVTTATRSNVMPDIPTVGEAVPGYELSGWVGIGVPKNTPIEIIEKLNGEINAGLANSKIKARLADLGGTPLAGAPTDFGRLITEHTDRWAKVIRTANIKPD